MVFLRYFPRNKRKEQKQRQQHQCNTSPQHPRLNHYYDCALPTNGLITWLPSETSLKYFCAGECPHVDILRMKSHQIPLHVLCENPVFAQWPGLSSATQGCEQNEQSFRKRDWEASQCFPDIRPNGALASQAWCRWSGFVQFSRQGAICVLPPEKSQFEDILCNSSMTPAVIAKILFLFSVGAGGVVVRPEEKLKISWWGPLQYLGDGTLDMFTPMPSLSHNNETLEFPDLLFPSIFILSKLFNISLKHWPQSFWKGFSSDFSIIILLCLFKSHVWVFLQKKKK